MTMTADLEDGVRANRSYGATEDRRGAASGDAPRSSSPDYSGLRARGYAFS
jgi:hypothetical protein